jgi:hypothetical protein
MQKNTSFNALLNINCVILFRSHSQIHSSHLLKTVRHGSYFYDLIIFLNIKMGGRGRGGQQLLTTKHSLTHICNASIH